MRCPKRDPLSLGIFSGCDVAEIILLFMLIFVMHRFQFCRKHASRYGQNDNKTRKIGTVHAITRRWFSGILKFCERCVNLNFDICWEITFKFFFTKAVMVGCYNSVVLSIVLHFRVLTYFIVFGYLVHNFVGSCFVVNN